MNTILIKNSKGTSVGMSHEDYEEISSILETVLKDIDYRRHLNNVVDNKNEHKKDKVFHIIKKLEIKDISDYYVEII